MTRKWVGVLAAGLLAAQAGCAAGGAPSRTPAPSPEQTPVLKTQQDMMNYAVGVSVARNLKQEGMSIEMDLIVKGMQDALSGEKLLLSEEVLRGTMNALQAELRQKQVQASRLAAFDNKKEGDAFLEENKTKERVVALPSGLQYKILMAGGGRTPTEADVVECRYRGTLINGTEFDSSGEQSATFKVAGLIPGWREALKLMPVGSKWQLFVPPELAYGARGSGRLIGPNATLIFELELLAVK